MIHADVKPGNVLLTRAGAAKLADLGLASLSSGRATEAHGTPRYRSPEQAKQQPSAATDVWSWAVTMIAVLLREEPAHAGGELAAYTLSALRARRPAHPALEHLDAVLTACLSKPPDARPTMTRVVDQLSARIARCTGAPPPRPPLGPAGTAAASELELLTQALQPLIDAPGACPPDQQDRALRLAIAKADCHRRAGDLAGAVTTLQRVLAAAPTGAAELGAAAWLDLGALHHERAAPDAAIHAFEQAASTIPIRSCGRAPTAGPASLAGSRVTAPAPSRGSAPPRCSPRTRSTPAAGPRRPGPRPDPARPRPHAARDRRSRGARSLPGARTPRVRQPRRTRPADPGPRAGDARRPSSARAGRCRTCSRPTTAPSRSRPTPAAA
jgi:hypothetical protein